MEVIEILNPYRIIVVGQTRSGKTFFVKNWLLKQIQRYVIYDPDREFNEEYGEIISDVEELNKMLRYDGRAWKRYNKNPKGLNHPRIIYQPSDTNFKSAKKRWKEFNEICSIINDQEDLFFIVDELSHITLAGDRQRPRLPEEFSLMIKRRMKMGIGIVVTTQRLKDSDSGLITQSQLIVMFNMVEIDIKYIEDKLGIKIPKKQVSILPDNYTKYDRNNLITVIDAPPYHCWIYNTLTKKIYLERVYEDGSTLTTGGVYREGHEPKKKKFKLYWGKG